MFSVTLPPSYDTACATTDFEERTVEEPAIRSIDKATLQGLVEEMNQLNLCRVPEAPKVRKVQQGEKAGKGDKATIEGKTAGNPAQPKLRAVSVDLATLGLLELLQTGTSRGIDEAIACTRRGGQTTMAEWITEAKKRGVDLHLTLAVRLDLLNGPPPRDPENKDVFHGVRSLGGRRLDLIDVDRMPETPKAWLSAQVQSLKPNHAMMMITPSNACVLAARADDGCLHIVKNWGDSLRYERDRFNPEEAQQFEAKVTEHKTSFQDKDKEGVLAAKEMAKSLHTHQKASEFLNMALTGPGGLKRFFVIRPVRDIAVSTT